MSVTGHTRMSFLDSLRATPKDITPTTQITERANQQIRAQRKRDADPFRKPFRAPASGEFCTVCGHDHWESACPNV